MDIGWSTDRITIGFIISSVLSSRKLEDLDTEVQDENNKTITQG